MNRYRVVICGLLTLFGLLTSGCVAIEQEIFLQPDGSGDLLLHIALPDFPEEMKQAPMGAANPEDALQKFKAEIVQQLPPTIKLKEAKEVRRNGTHGFYAVFQFKRIADVQALMADVLKETAKDAQTGARKPSQWTLKLEKQGALTDFTQLFAADLSESKVETSGNVKLEVSAAPTQSKKRTRASRAGRAQAAPKPDAAGGFGEMEKLGELLYSAIKFRFVLHTPAPIVDSNADIVLNGKTALWDCSLAAFAKEKKPIEMKARF